MRRLRAAAVFVAALAVTRVAAQDGPAFEVASIRSNTSGDPVSGTHNLPGGRVTITNLPLRNMIRTAYGANDLEVIGGRIGWMAIDGTSWPRRRLGVRSTRHGRRC